MPIITRRKVLQLSGSSLAVAATLPCTNILSQENEDLGWEEFLKLCDELADTQFAEDWQQSQDVYTKKVEKLLVRLNLEDDKIIDFIESYNNYNTRFPEIRTIHRKTDFQVSLLEFEAEEKIPLHDHPDMTGVVICTHGKIEVNHYDKLTEASVNDLPLLQTERNLTMTPGTTATLTTSRGNIHELHAKEFTRMIDVFTPPYNRERTSRSRYYWIGKNAYDERTDVFEAEMTRSPFRR
ncbi:MAG: hypothetical protein F4Z01_08620 [Gammaproteobacteria bacterium]|nr:hypothetical protein [Gammaproteobacteria bacterium]MYF38139.1 hypothetical protein [Gammaproteobacteria bacterium]